MTIKQVLEDKRKQLEDYLNTLLNDEGDLLQESMAYSLRAGGKRLRPALFLITSELYGLESEKVLPFAAGI